MEEKSILFIHFSTALTAKYCGERVHAIEISQFLYCVWSFFYKCFVSHWGRMWWALCTCLSWRHEPKSTWGWWLLIFCCPAPQIIPLTGLLCDVEPCVTKPSNLKSLPSTLGKINWNTGFGKWKRWIFLETLGHVAVLICCFQNMHRSRVEDP